MLLDADVLIDLERGHPNARTWLASLTVVPPAAGFAAMELLNACQNRMEQRRVEKFLRPFPLLWPFPLALQSAFTTFTTLRLAHGVGLMDALIAATAIEQGRYLATFNVRHFRAVPNLTMMQPYLR